MRSSLVFVLENAGQQACYCVTRTRWNSNNCKNRFTSDNKFYFYNLSVINHRIALAFRFIGLSFPPVFGGAREDSPIERSSRGDLTDPVGRRLLESIFLLEDSHERRLFGILFEAPL